ncbi:Hint domain-containing protein [Shimia sp. R11_0]|uniref:Hint domain-containing protein n=1 Tax=Shimia sp. R11_0 TaxID=2821096 RepID=UPI001ADB54F2|nr:Hint domain-containing protein [Shimia sp. R11_0]MBO9476829.1 Hint domain-containing protein [Shimia sp. R11_0]
MPTATELNINTSATAQQMANEIFGDPSRIVSADYTGDPLSSGIYTGADSTSPGVAPADSGVILSTGHVSDFTNNSGTSNTNERSNTSTDTSGQDNNALFNAAAGATTFDASYLTVDFNGTAGELLTIDFVLSSEEYPEFLSFNDAIGVWVNGVEAQISIGDGSASIGNINDANQNIYNDNSNDQFNTEMDGFTVTLTFVVPLQDGVNELVIGIADASDARFDSNLLIAGGSVQSAIVAQDDALSVKFGGTRVLNVLDNDSSSAGPTLAITHINGIAVSATGAGGLPNSVTLSTGQVVTLNANGTLTVDANTDNETVYFNYTIEDTSGASDTALVEIEQRAPCFTAGTLIQTSEGHLPVEELRAGMLLRTLDSGYQPIRWIGRSHITPRFETLPIRIKAGVLDNKTDLVVSPQHRVLLRGAWAELLFGCEEVLVKAKDLVNDKDILREHTDQTITYFHILMPQHELLFSKGQWSESFLPGPMTLNSFDPFANRSLRQVIAQQAHDRQDTAARPSLRSFEARALLAA